MAGDGLFETTSIPGHLAPTPERLERLLAKQPLEELYEVEEQPFARGKYATVRRCRERASGQQCAAKFLKKRRRAQELRAEALHEVAVLDAAADCPRLVSLHRVFETPTDMVLVLELAPGGELQMVLDKDEIPEERQAAKLLRQILDGVAFLHSLNVAHLDIKPQNLVLTGDFPHCDVKLCDFGISRYISQGADIREILGTPDYVAPEVLNYEPISLATDMWSVGVLLYVLLTGCSPFGGDTKQETFCNISRCKLDFPDDLFEDVSEDARDLIRRLIVKSPGERLSAADCLQHAWLAKFEQIPALLFQSAEPTEEEEEETVAVRDNDSCPTSSLTSVDESSSPSSSPPSSSSSSLSSSLSSSSSPSPSPSSSPSPPPFANEEERNSEVDSESNDSGSTVQLADVEPGPKIHHIPIRTEEATDGSSASSMCINLSGDFDFLSSRLSSSFNRSSSSSGSSTTARHNFSGLSSERRSNFKRSMDFLARKFSASADLLEMFDDFDLETSSRRSSVTTASESVFKCSPVFILGEEQQCSDSGSDTVSEISTDSSSDRSSIYSDDSLDFILYGKTSQGRVSFPFSASETLSWKQRNGIGSNLPSSSTNSLRHGPRVWPRECSGVVSKALSRFTSPDQHHHHHHHNHYSAHMSTSSSSSSSSKPSVVMSSSSSSNTTSSSITLATSSATRTSTTRSITGLEALRSRGENLVVIREPVRAGRYMRYSEVQCESVQARIRRFQVHGSTS